MPSAIKPTTEIVLPVRDYDLAATLDSGQVFRWRRSADGSSARSKDVNLRASCPRSAPLSDFTEVMNCSWIGVVGKNWVRLTQMPGGIFAETARPVANWQWLRDYLQSEVDLEAVLKTFPDDEPMRAAVNACRGLRVLRQEPWECLASFILSSTKQIVQIRQIIALLCERFGERLAPRPSFSSDCYYSFPTPEKIARATEAELRACKMGFRAPHLLAAARRIAEGKFDLEQPRRLPLAEARAELMKLRGVGGKIADCVLLFAYGFDSAFPVDVWVERALRRLYFPRRRVTAKRLRRFATTHFGPHAGYAQQYLFHYMRTKLK